VIGEALAQPANDIQGRIGTQPAGAGADLHVIGDLGDNRVVRLSAADGDARQKHLWATRVGSTPDAECATVEVRVRRQARLSASHEIAGRRHPVDFGY
jgi:hypothetical protein